MTRSFLILWIALTISAAMVDAQPATGRIVLDTSAIFDGRGGVLRNQQIVIEGSRIVSVGTAASASASNGSAAAYDLRGLTVLPGFIDTHVHISWHFDADHKLVSGREDPKTSALFTAENAWVTLQGGFTTVQSVGAAIDADVRDRINNGSLPGPRILTSFRQINQNSGNPDALHELVRQTKADGADVIKLFATAGMGAGGAQTMTDDQIRAVCEEARTIGMRAIVHAISDAGAKASVLAGCTGIEHGDFVEDGTLKLMADRGVFFDPNFLVLHNYIESKSSFPNINEQGFKALEDAIGPTRHALERARALKVKVVLGTDAVAGAHGRNAEEFIYRVREGRDSPMDALLSGTSVAAESLGLGSLSMKDKIGTIAPGFEADLVATDGNPLEDITAVRRVVWVMKGGRVYKNVRR
jgi:imidazolonepropionase-like amidohydrolase